MPPIPSGFSPLETWLIALIVAGCSGLITLITWAVKIVLPRVLAMSDERTGLLRKAVDFIPAAMDRFDKGFAAHEVSATASEARIIAKIDERRFDDLREELRRRPSADELPPPTSGRRV